MSIQKTLVLNTCHMPWVLKDMDEEEDFGDQRVTRHAFGMMVFVALETESSEVAQMMACTPEWFQPILSFALEHGCSFINFDEEATVLRRFHNYDEDKTEEVARD